MKTIDDVLAQPYMQALIKRVCDDDYIVISRPAMFAVKRPAEDERDINRLIVLPPRGYTANKINQTNCFHNVETATIEILGAAREEKRALSVIKNCLLNVSYDQMEKVSGLDRPYLEFDVEDKDSGFIYRRFSAGEPPFHVVKIDGTGFYHTLINLSDDWLVLKLHKVLREEKVADLTPHLMGVQDEYANALRQMMVEIIEVGDELFKTNPSLVTKVMRMQPSVSLPALGEMLYVRDTGRHETCTAFGMILKIGRREPEATLKFLKKGLEAKSIPTYFAEQLIQKVRNMVAEKEGTAASQVA
jgi:hypothetical protein